MANIDELFVITGGPGSGKTALLAALARAGVQHMPESGRAVIRDQVAIGGNALPWSDRLAFAELMLSHDMRSHRESLNTKGPVVFDRGVPDVLGYCKVSGLAIPEHLVNAATRVRYHHRVFIAPPWRAIFTTDAERRQSFEEAEATFHAMADVYTACGYELVHLPLASLDERVDFVRAIMRPGSRR